MSLSYSHGREFVAQARPFLESRDSNGLARHIQKHWPGCALRELLTCGHQDAVNSALVGLALTGSMADGPAVALLLADDDADTASYAEYTLWALWFRGAEEPARNALCQAVQLIGNNDLDAAIVDLDKLLHEFPNYAEAYNQRAIAYFLKEDYGRSLVDCRETLRLNPQHFGAMAGAGHCHTALGQLPQALEAYRRSLLLHPRLEGVRESIRQIRAKLADPSPARTRQAPAPEPAGPESQTI